MKKIISYVLFSVVMILQLSGCGTDKKEPSGVSNTVEVQDVSRTHSQAEPMDSKDTLDSSTVLNSGTQDNSLDVYTAIVNAPLQVENPVNALKGGGSKIFLAFPEPITLKNISLKMWMNVGTRFPLLL